MRRIKEVLRLKEGCHYLPLCRDAKADQGCRKRRNQVPDWSEITCRIGAKSPAAFDRNQVPVCSDFCTLPDHLRIPGEVARESRMMSPSIPI